MRLTVLGSSGTAPAAGRVCSGYLVQSASATVMLDAGNGSSANLLRVVSLGDLDAIVVSHRHADHCVDLIGLHHTLRALQREGTGVDRRIRLYAHESVVETLAALSSREAPYVFAETFDVHLVGPGDRFVVGDLDITLYASVHSAPAVSMRLVADGRVLVYSGDSAGGEQLVEAARDADLLLCEATWQGAEADHDPGIHLTARGAGAVATAAGARRLMLTHVAGHLDREVSRREAAETYTLTDVELADDLLVTQV